MYKTELCKSEHCSLCGEKSELNHIIICPLLNDPYLAVCRECGNDQKIKINEAKFKASIWNTKL